MWITRDGGAHWQTSRRRSSTPWSKIAQIDTSRADDDTAFVAVNRFRLDDLRPYVYVTHDGGAHWQLAVDGLPNEPVNAVRQDPAGAALALRRNRKRRRTSRSMPARTGRACSSDLPHTSVRDIIVHGNDAIVATHGRGFWILDDVTPLRALARRNGDLRRAARRYLFAPETRVSRAAQHEHRHAVAARGTDGTESARRRDHRLRVGGATRAASR